MKNNVIQEFLDKLTPEDHARIERNMYEHEAKERWLEECGYEYGTETSYSLKLLNDRGFFPIGITYFICEEVFIFRTKEEAEKAFEKMEVKSKQISGWWYSKRQFQKEIANDEYFNSIIYWLSDKIKPIWKARVKEQHVTNEGCRFQIIACTSQKNCTIKFLEHPFNFLYNISYVAILNKNIKNPYHPSVCGVGYIGVGDYRSQIDGKKTRYYTCWVNMLKRSYSEKVHKTQPSYIDIVVCEEWHNFQNFAKWHEENWRPWMDTTWELDKDILVSGNKIYSPDTCCFIPKEINSIIRDSGIKNNGLPTCVSKVGKRYLTFFKNKNFYKYIGTFDTPEEAFVAYKLVKKDYIKQIAEKWKGNLDLKAYEAILNYEIKNSNDTK